MEINGRVEKQDLLSRQRTWMETWKSLDRIHWRSPWCNVLIKQNQTFSIKLWILFVLKWVGFVEKEIRIRDPTDRSLCLFSCPFCNSFSCLPSHQCLQRRESNISLTSLFFLFVRSLFFLKVYSYTLLMTVLAAAKFNFKRIRSNKRTYR